MPEISYSFEEFCDHLAALEIVRKYDHIDSANGETIEITDEPCLENMACRVMDYMRQLYPYAPEAFFKGSRFVMILGHASRDIQKFEAARLAVFGGEGKDSLLHPKAWRAFHYFYAVRESHMLGKVTTEEIIDYANSLPDETDV